MCEGAAVRVSCVIPSFPLGLSLCLEDGEGCLSLVVTVEVITAPPRGSGRLPGYL